MHVYWFSLPSTFVIFKSGVVKLDDMYITESNAQPSSGTASNVIVLSFSAVYTFSPSSPVLSVTPEINLILPFPYETPGVTV